MEREKERRRKKNDENDERKETNKQQKKNIRNSKGFGIIWLNNNSNNNGIEPSNSNHILFLPMFARKTHLSFDKRKRQPGSKQINN